MRNCFFILTFLCLYANGQTVSIQANPSQLVNAPNTIAAVGDSITMQNFYGGLSYTNSPGNFGSGAWSIDYIEMECPAGNGTLTYNGVDLTWAPQGLSSGSSVNATRTGKLYVPGPSANQGIWVNWFVNRGGYSSGSATVTVQSNGMQAWNYSASGFIVQALAQSGQKMLMATDAAILRGREAFYGLGGASSSDIVSAAWQWKQIIADAYIEGTGTNDVNGSVAPATTNTNRQQVWDWVLGQGKILIIMSVPPRDNNTATQNRYRYQLNKFAATYAATHARSYYANMDRYIVDQSNDHYVSGYAADSPAVHPSGLGAYYGGKPLGAILASLKTTDNSGTTYGDTYDATNNPFGNLLATSGQGTWQGVGGSLGSGCTGSFLGDGWSCARSTGANIAAALSKTSRTDGVTGQWQTVTLSGATTSEVITIQNASNASIATYSAGTVIEAMLEVQVVSSSGLTTLDLQIAPTVVSGRSASAYNEINGDILAGQTLWLKIPQYTIPSGSTGFYPVIKIGTGNGGSVVINLGRVYFRKK